MTKLPSVFTFDGGNLGPWRVKRQESIRGEGLALVPRLCVSPISQRTCTEQTSWSLKGQVSNVRYAHREELQLLRARQERLGRPQATLAALIPIRKSAAWWELAQDERRAIFEEQSHHTRIGLDYLPGVARQLFHARDLGEEFDFLTWFEFAAQHESEFNELLLRLRKSPEWSYVEREAEIRLERDEG